MTLTQGQTGREKVGRGGKGRERLGPAFLYLIPRSHGHMDEEGEEHGQGCVYPEIHARPQTPISPYFTRTSSQTNLTLSHPIHDSSNATSFPHKTTHETSSPSSPLSPARSLDSSFLGENEQEDARKNGGGSRQSGLKTPSPRLRGQGMVGLLTPSASPEDKRRKGMASEFAASSSSESGLLRSPVSPTTNRAESKHTTAAFSTTKVTRAEVDPIDTTSTFSSSFNTEGQSTTPCTPTCLLLSPRFSEDENTEILSISCDLCETLYHTICLGLPETEEEAERVLPDLFYCQVCRPGWCRGLVRRLRRERERGLGEEEKGQEGHGRGVFVFEEVDGEDGVSEVVGVLEGGMDFDDEEDEDDEDESDTLRAKSTGVGLTKPTTTKRKSTAQIDINPAMPTSLPAPTVDPLKTYTQQYEHFFSLFAGSSERGRGEMEVLARRNERLGRLFVSD